MLKISEGTGKLEHIQSINTNPLTNPFCNRTSKKKGLVCSKCYSRRACSSYRSRATEAWDRNAEVLTQPMTAFPPINAAFFRFHSHGELLNTQHFLNFCGIARANRHCTFALWTKRHRIVQANLAAAPENMVLVFSNPVIDTITQPPKGFDKSFNVIKRLEVEANCGVKCWDCMKCYDKTEEQIIIERLK